VSSAADCGVVKNKASVTTTNGSGGDSDVASVTVLCPGLTLAKKADAALVTAGQQIGFIVTASNPAGPGTAHGVVIDDPLPSGSGVNWSIASGPDNCSILGSPPSETLHCDAVDLAVGASEVVHVVSGTSTASCRVYPNVASLTATNAPALTANATTTVSCPIVSPPQVTPPTLPNTGGPDSWILAAGMALLLGGSMLVAGDRRRRRRS
jgi:uncharacterized repeat protein (TIGR01451 family)/LPXTG-motif cell wall-anchored protein